MTLFPPEIYLRIVVSMLMGLIIGYERTLYNKPAGMRTFSLVSVGSTLIMLVSVYGAEKMGITLEDPFRIAAQIVSGIGFLGAGVIWNSKGGGMKHGVTTAAELWVTSAVGMALGVGMYDLAVLVVACVFFAIFIGRKVEQANKEKETQKESS
ncbi:MgtC/SapB family protein [Desulforamulus ruminis]|uniref:MgtC/SapB transporter n=1 Tax=Desulforamulus ruminis (strain ATCC 23193 / DSM 2154 / NCIMB 8452 / DL) TaxID=696281 RepID=F6DLM6_DESRL|nr:MgtC/SapB family protein [Desulforamulus ruminis]AEG61668.1 MgtC/SapB transporter [Desulforamulus ruminis DSM 2154]